VAVARSQQAVILTEMMQVLDFMEMVAPQEPHH
jgi:hypothetical protein